MTLERDLSGLPTAEALATWEPEEHGLLAPAVEAWWAAREEAGFDRPMADETLPYRASWASLRCDRQLWYALHGAEQSNPPSVAGHWRFATGSMGHALLQEFLSAGLGDERVLVLEQSVDLTKIGIPGSGHADGIVYEELDGERTRAMEVIEIKTVGGYKFKSAVMKFRGHGPEGPDWSAVVQGSMMAAALDCGLRVCYVALENISAEIAGDRGLSEERKFSAEWVLDADACAEIATVEAKRINELLADPYVATPLLHDPEYTPGATVTNQAAGKGGMKGTWVAQTAQGPVHGDTWFCGYCGQRDRCISDGL